MDLLTTRQVAEILFGSDGMDTPARAKNSIRKVLHYIESGQLRARQYGRDWMINRRDAEAFRIPTKGRRPKEKQAA